MLKDLLKVENTSKAILLFLIALACFFLPGNIFKYASIVLFILAALNLYFAIKKVRNT